MVVEIDDRSAGTGPRESMSEASESEATLMTAYVQGDPLAFSKLFDRLAPRIHAFFMRSFRDSAIADDLLQTTFLKMHRGRSSYRLNEAVKPWLFSIAARVRLDELRKRYRLPPTAGEDALEAVPDEGPAPPELLDGRTRDAEVRAAVDRLPETQRVVIHLHRFEGLSFLEIAKLLESTEGAVRIRAFRGYETLRKQLRHLLDGGRG